MNLRPLDDRVVIEPNEEPTHTKGGIYLPDERKREVPTKGKVLAVGVGKWFANGERGALSVKVGDTVIYGRYAGADVEIEDVSYKIIRESDILAVEERHDRA